MGGKIIVVYDYRIKAEELSRISINFDNLSGKQQLKVAEAIKNIKQEKEQEARIYFNNVILPILKDFAELTSSLLMIEENNKNQTVTAILKNSCSLDITENCRYMRGLLVIANYINIAVEDEEIILSLIFDYEKLN